jgi:two-component system response regulator YesN
LYRELEQSGRITDFQAILQELVVNLVRKSRHQKNDRITITIKRALDYIDKNHHCQELGLKEVAENSFVCSTYLSRILSKETGKTYVEHLHKTRIKYAKEYLVDSALQVQEISQNVGFSDPHYFSKVFRKYTKMTPVEYRTRYFNK